jgi:IPT/TIG domain-containing protein
MSRVRSRTFARASLVVAAVAIVVVQAGPASWAAAPTITSFSPTTGAVGTTVTIYGTDLKDATAVRFNGTSATFATNGFTKITTQVPAGATTGPISVTTPEGTATSPSVFTVTSASVPAPTISSFSPTSGPVGTLVTINGTNFTGTTSVKFNGLSAPSFTVVSSAKITVTVPTGATTGKISVTNPAGTATSAQKFTVTTSKPTISSFSPTSGPVGTSVTINGTNFTGATSVKFGGVSGTFVVNSSIKITAVVPAGAVTGKITVTTPSGTATSTAAFTVTGNRHARTISLDLRRHLRVSGIVTVADGFAACASDVPVLIQRHPLNSGTWRTILRVSTQTSGAYGAHVPNRSGRYRARATKVELSSGVICGRATSEIERYRR